VPRAEVIAVLVNPTNPDIEARLRDLRAAALAMGQQIKLLTATSESEIEAAFATSVQHPVGAMLVQNDPFLSDARREQILALTARHRVPAAYEQRTIVESGGLMSYGANRADIHRQVGIYAGRILKGEKPADLPVQQPTKFDLVINLKTAKVLGLDVPDKLLALADEVME
jgi:putative ABC transport system substrate-binding protein